MRLGAVLGAALALAMAGCSADYVEGDSSTVLLLIESINDGAPILSDVRGAGDNPDTIVNCRTEAKVSVRTKNPSQTAATVQDVRLTRYEVSYRRSDGRGVQGVDVPYTISGNVTMTVPAGGETTSFPIDLVRHQAKLLPPLSNITGLQLVTMFADVTLNGATISGSNVSAQGSAQVTFADYATGTTTCEAGVRRQVMRVSLGNAGLRPLLVFVATLGLVTAGCGLGKVEDPPLVGPSETGLSVQLTALPDVLNADGVSQAVVQMVMRDANGKAVTGERSCSARRHLPPRSWCPTARPRPDSSWLAWARRTWAPCRAGSSWRPTRTAWRTSSGSPAPSTRGSTSGCGRTGSTPRPASCGRSRSSSSDTLGRADVCPDTGPARAQAGPGAL